MQSYKRTAFYFIAHADDWQLFMAPEISLDIVDEECKVVIIHTTAGDAGKDKAYWRAREIASIESLLFRLSAIDQHLSPQEQNQSVSSHACIYTYSVRNCIMYFLRLPDGNYDGTGFTACGNQSMNKFRSGKCADLTPLDNQSVYSHWDQLVTTLDEIISVEKTTSGIVTLNLPDSDLTRNSKTHNDHYNTALLVQRTKAYHQYPGRIFIDYALINSNDLMNGEELFWKIGMFTAYDQAVFRETGHSTIAEDPNFIPWCFRNSCWRSTTP